MSLCPRCQAAEENISNVHTGLNAKGELVWNIFHCSACSFSWRDSELPTSIDYDKREAFFRVDTNKPYPIIMPVEQ